jgi:predicted transcriptional regulator
MSEQFSFLKSELLRDYEEILPTMKSLANEKRMMILILLLDGPKSFQYLLNATALQKTALSNHLTQLANTKLLGKPNFGLYQIQTDGIAFMRTFYQTWKNSLTYQANRLKKEEERQFSPNFLSDFFHSK